MYYISWSHGAHTDTKDNEKIVHDSKIIFSICFNIYFMSPKVHIGIHICVRQSQRIFLCNNFSTETVNHLQML